MKSKRVRDRDGFRKRERVVRTENDALILSSCYQLTVLELGLIERMICSVSEGVSQNFYRNHIPLSLKGSNNMRG